MLYGIAIAAVTWLWFRLHWATEGNFLLACAMAPLLLSTGNIHWLARPHVFSWAFLLAALLCAMTLGGCASFSPDGGFTLVEQTTRSRLGKDVQWVRSDADQGHPGKSRLAGKTALDPIRENRSVRREDRFRFSSAEPEATLDVQVAEVAHAVPGALAFADLRDVRRVFAVVVRAGHDAAAHADLAHLSDGDRRFRVDRENRPVSNRQDS